MKAKMKWLIPAASFLALVVISLYFAYISFFGAPQKSAELELFTAPVLGMDRVEAVKSLSDQDFVRSAWALGFALARGDQKIAPGGYWVSKDMDVWELSKTITSPPSLKWVVIPEGLRKEEIGERLAQTLGWDDQQLSDWTYTYTAMDFDHLEGVYFPDTYLIPINETGLEIANRMRRRFDEEFAPYMTKFLKQNVKWTTAIKIASIVQREAAGKEDMPIIAGILWNRLLKNMKLEVDATVQYARDDQQNLTTGFWKPIVLADKDIDSKYNTYKYSGLPPFPIANPGLDAIEAVINPAETDCLYYLHDANREIHCAKTYEEHLQNIANYLQR